MSKLIDGKIYVAPNKTTKVKIYPHGFVEPVTDISETDGELIEYASAKAMEMLGSNASPFEVFELMGWLPEIRAGKGEAPVVHSNPQECTSECVRRCNVYRQARWKE